MTFLLTIRAGSSPMPNAALRKNPCGLGHGQATELRKGNRRERGGSNSSAAISSAVANAFRPIIRIADARRGRSQNLNVLFAGRLSKLAAIVACLP
jgi:hypothetical protein